MEEKKEEGRGKEEELREVMGGDLEEEKGRRWRELRERSVERQEEGRGREGGEEPL